MSRFHIEYADVFLSRGEIPSIVLSPKIADRVSHLAEMIAEVMQSNIPNKELEAVSLLKNIFVYCNSNCNLRTTDESNNHYLDIVSRLKRFVLQNLENCHRVSEYSEMMHLTSKYLNAVVKD